MESDTECIKNIISNFRQRIEEDLREEELSENPEQEVIEDYKKALAAFSTINEHKLLTYVQDYISESVGL